MNQSLIVTGYDDIYRAHRWAKKCFKPRYVTEIIKGWNGLESFAIMPTGRKHAESYRQEEVDKLQRVLLEVKTDVTVLLVEHDEAYPEYDGEDMVGKEILRVERLI